jgi:hypothetical protein
MSSVRNFSLINEFMNVLGGVEKALRARLGAEFLAGYLARNRPNCYHRRKAAYEAIWLVRQEFVGAS